MMCAAAFALTNCDKQSTEPQRPSEGSPFEIIASAVDTKTANDGLKTVWAENDAINLFHAVTGTAEYGTNDKFTWTGTDNKFSGTLTEALETGKSYDWYALYPYNKFILTPGERTDGYTYIGDTRGVNQDGNNSTAHLCKTLCPLYGVAKGVDANSSVNIAMHHLASVVKIVVENSNDADLTVKSITFTAEESIVGSYFIDITKSPVAYTLKNGSNEETLNVINGTPIKKGNSAAFYIPIKPFKATSGSTLKISVNNCDKSLVMQNEVNFQAGQIKSVNFKYNKEVQAGRQTEYVFQPEKDNNNRNAYAKNYSITINDLNWNVPGNLTLGNFIRIGGKNIDKVTRYLYSEDVIPVDVNKIVISTNGISRKDLTVHSVSLKIYKNAADAKEGNDSYISSFTNNDADWAVSTAKEITFMKEGTTWSDCYYRFEFNVSNSNSKNCGIDLTKIVFSK